MMLSIWITHIVGIISYKFSICFRLFMRNLRRIKLIYINLSYFNSNLVSGKVLFLISLLISIYLFIEVQFIDISYILLYIGVVFILYLRNYFKALLINSVYKCIYKPLVEIFIDRFIYNDFIKKSLRFIFDYYPNKRSLVIITINIVILLINLICNLDLGHYYTSLDLNDTYLFEFEDYEGYVSMLPWGFGNQGPNRPLGGNQPTGNPQPGGGGP